MDIKEKKDIVLQMVSLHPSDEWYKQCLEMNFTSDELLEIEGDKEFLLEVQGVLFLEKQKLMKLRRTAIEVSAAKGGWQGFDKLLQEIDRKTFTVARDLKLKGENLFDIPPKIILTGKSNDE